MKLKGEIFELRNSLEILGVFGQLKSLQALHLAHNQLRTFPEFFGQFNLLYDLHLGTNHLITIPESFGQLLSLKFLNLYSNKLTTLPESLCKLPKLEKIHTSERDKGIVHRVLFCSFR
jgi:Leucine-rich repeat (LRR) protein